jgi:phosphomannomutase
VTGALDLAGGLARLPASDVLIYRMGGARLVVRPSGTEPKLKAYLEVVAPLGGAGLENTRRLAAETLDRLRDAVMGALAT